VEPFDVSYLPLGQTLQSPTLLDPRVTPNLPESYLIQNAAPAAE
jgi:hypothetical protein